MSDLFRPEAVRNLQNSLRGEVILGVRPIWTVLGYLMGLTVAAILLALCLTTYVRRETVSGWIVPQGGLVRVAARNGGTVETINVREGEKVSAGQVLAVVRSSVDILDGNAGAAITGNVEAELRAASAAGRAEESSLTQELATLKARQMSLKQRRADAKDVVRIAMSRLDLADQNLRRTVEVREKGYLSQRDVDQARSAVLSAQQDLAASRDQLSVLDQQAREVEGDIAAIPLRRNEAVSRTAGAEALIRQRLDEAKTRDAYLVTAPVAGEIVALPAHVGQSISAQSALMVLVPGGEALEAELFVPSRAAGFIRAGQPVSVRYQAFPYQKFGFGKGKVKQISRTVLAPAELPAAAPPAAEPVFRVRAILDRPYVEAYSVRMPVQPGMLVSADIETDRRSLLEWLLDPVFAAARR